MPLGAFAGAVHEQVMPLEVIFVTVTAVGAPGSVPLPTVLTVNVDEDWTGPDIVHGADREIITS